MPFSAGHVRRRLVVQSSKTLVVHMTTLPTLIQTQSIMPLQTHHHHHHQFGTKRFRGAGVRHRFSVSMDPMAPRWGEDVPIDDFRLSAAFHHGFASVDDVNLETESRHRATVMRCPPKFLSGAYVSAMRVAMQEIRWKLFFMLPRILLQKPRKGDLVPTSKLRERFAQFADGRWMDLIVSSKEAAVAASNAKARRARRAQILWNGGLSGHARWLLLEI